MRAGARNRQTNKIIIGLTIAFILNGVVLSFADCKQIFNFFLATTNFSQVIAPLPDVQPSSSGSAGTYATGSGQQNLNIPNQPVISIPSPIPIETNPPISKKKDIAAVPQVDAETKKTPESAFPTPGDNLEKLPDTTISDYSPDDTPGADAPQEDRPEIYDKESRTDSTKLGEQSSLGPPSISITKALRPAYEKISTCFAGTQGMYVFLWLQILILILLAISIIYRIRSK